MEGRLQYLQDIEQRLKQYFGHDAFRRGQVAHLPTSCSALAWSYSGDFTTHRTYARPGRPAQSQWHRSYLYQQLSRLPRTVAAGTRCLKWQGEVALRRSRTPLERELLVSSRSN